MTLASNSKPLVLEARLWYFAEWLSETRTRHVGKQAAFQASGVHSARRQVWASGAEASGSLDSTLVTVGTPDGGFLGGQRGWQAALSCDLWDTEAVGTVSFCELSA